MESTVKIEHGTYENTKDMMNLGQTILNKEKKQTAEEIIISSYISKSALDIFNESLGISKVKNAENELKNCKVCGTSFTDKYLLKSHMDDMHKVLKRIPIDTGWVITYSNKSNYQNKVNDTNGNVSFREIKKESEIHFDGRSKNRVGQKRTLSEQQTPSEIIENLHKSKVHFTQNLPLLQKSIQFSIFLITYFCLHKLKSKPNLNP